MLVGDGEQAASLLDDLAAVPAGDPVHPFHEVRGPVQRHRLGELCPPAMLARKARPYPATTPITALASLDTPECRLGRYPAKSHGSSRAYNPQAQSRWGAARPG